MTAFRTICKTADCLKLLRNLDDCSRFNFLPHICSAKHIFINDCRIAVSAQILSCFCSTQNRCHCKECLDYSSNLQWQAGNCRSSKPEIYSARLYFPLALAEFLRSASCSQMGLFCFSYILHQPFSKFQTAVQMEFQFILVNHNNFLNQTFEHDLIEFHHQLHAVFND